MFKRFLSLTLFLPLLLTFDGLGQPWTYDFGSGTGSHTTNASSTTFLPQPTSGEDRVRVGSAGGSFNLENQTISFGSGSYLRGVAPTTTSVNKFSVYDYTAGKAAILSFRIRLGASDGSASANSGIWFMFLGDGANFSDNNAFTGAQMFTGIQWTFGASGAITTTYRNGSNWTALGSTPFSQGNDYLVDIYANNTTGTLNYVKGTSQSVAANKVDIWVNGVLVGDDLAKAQLSNDVNIDSYMFYGASSSSNVANIFLDDFSYSNTITSPALTPPTLTADATNNTVDNDIEITFTDDASWRAAITAVKVGGTALTATTDYVIGVGKITLLPSGLNSLLTTSGSKSITVEATGYNNASVTQQISAGAPTTNSTAAISGALALGTTRTVTATAKDQYNNLVSGYTFKYDAAINNSLPYTTESYTIDGTARTLSVSDIDVLATTNSSGVATFTIAVPTVVDQGDGLIVQVQLANGTSNIGDGFSIIGPTPTVTYTGDDPTTNSFAIPSDANVLYRVKLDVTDNPAELAQFTFNVQGNYAAADINTFELWYSTNSTFEPASDAGLGNITPSGDGSQTLLFNLSTRQFMSASGTHYLFLTVSVGGGRGSDITVLPKPAFTDIQFLETVNPAGTFGDATVHTFLERAPDLTADNTNNTVDNQIDITFSDDNWWGNVTGVKVNGTSLAANDWDIERGHLFLFPSNGNPLLTASGEKTVAVDATDYATASVTQTILPGAIVANNSTVGVSPALTLGGTSTVTATAKDQYSNNVSGYTFKYDVTVTDNNATTDESYSIDGTARTSSASDLSVTAATNASGVATFDIIIPGTVDANDGLSVQIQLNNGTTDVGSPVTFGNTPGVTITGTDPGSGNFMRSATQQILYRYQIAVTKAAVTLNQVVAALSGTYTADDLGARSLKLYYSTNTTLDGADPQIGSSVTPVSTGSGESITFSTIGKVLPIGTSYVFLTTDMRYDATLGRTIAGASSQDAQLTFLETVTLTPGTYGGGNPHEITKIPGAPTDLIISEYVEGSSFNKYIEVFNGSTAPIELSDYELRLFSAASTTPTSQTLTGTLSSNSTIVYKHGSSTLYSGAATAYNSVINYNGDDQVAIYKTSTSSYVDIFGRIGTDPGTAWTGDGGYSTENKTLRRKSSVTEGISTNPASGFPTLTTEWDLFELDNVSGLGSHSISVYTSNYSQAVPTGASTFNFLNTGVQINFVNVTTGATVTVTRYEGGPTGTTGITESNVSNFRWVIEDDGIVLGDPASIRFKASSLTGIVDPAAATIKLYKRSTPGSGSFTLVGTLTYDAATDEFFVSGITSFSEFVMASEGSPLPVELTSFTASAKGTSVTLSWETKTEIDNNGFEVERNTTGTWQKIGFVEGHGTANSPKYYSFSDNNPLGNKIQYRLKQIDNDGDFEYSSIVEVELAPVSYTLYQNYPNPFNPSTVIRFAIPVAGNVTVNVFNTLGEKVATLQDGQLESGYHQVTFDAANLPSGLYFYEVQAGEFKSIKKMLLMK